MPDYTGYITNARAARTAFETLHAKHDQKSHGRGGKSGGKKGLVDDFYYKGYACEIHRRQSGLFYYRAVKIGSTKVAAAGTHTSLDSARKVVKSAIDARDYVIGTGLVKD